MPSKLCRAEKADLDKRKGNYARRSLLQRLETRKPRNQNA
jgi:hypothetical protein